VLRTLRGIGPVGYRSLVVGSNHPGRAYETRCVTGRDQRRPSTQWDMSRRYGKGAGSRTRAGGFGGRCAAVTLHPSPLSRYRTCTLRASTARSSIRALREMKKPPL